MIETLAGQYYDSETGLHYNYHRYYDPATGRYLTPDPIGLAGGINLFAYVQNNPVNYIDSLGLSPSFDQNNDGMRDDGCSQFDMPGFDFTPLDMTELVLMAVFPEVMVPVIIGGKVTKSAFDVAKQGGKHAGFLKNNIGRGTEDLQKGIAKLEKQIALHQDKIINPSKQIKNWNKLDPRQQKALINKKWPSDIQRHMEQRNILQGIIKSRN